MSKFGSYQQVERLDATGTVFTAHKGDSGPVDYVIKYCEPGQPAKAAALRSGAELQKVISKKLPHWAVVEEIQPFGPDGVYVVYKNYPSSVKRMVDQKFLITPELLAKIAEQVSTALAELASQYGRPHGIVKSTNILLTDPDPSRATCFLTDPAPQDSPAAKDLNSDRKGVGKLLFELVTGLEYQEYFWPLRTSRKWDSLGPTGPKWLEWTSRLLAPPGNTLACNLDKFRSELAEKKREMPGAKGKSFASVFVVLLLLAAAAGGGYWYLKIRPQMASVQPPPTPTVPPPATAPAPVVTPPPQPKPAPATAPTPQPSPESVVAQQQQLLAAQQAAQSNLDTEIINFAALADEMHTLAPDLYDFAADVQTARNVTLSPGDTVADITQNGQESLANVREIRRIAVHQALANARTFNFKHQPITQAFNLCTATLANTEDSLKPLATMIAAMKQVDSAWPSDSPLPPDVRITSGQAQAINDAYFNSISKPATAAAQAIANNPSSAAGAVKTFNDNLSALQQTAVNVAAQFQAVADANELLSSTVFPPSLPLWESMAKRLASLGSTPAGWPDAHLTDAMNQINMVLAAVRAGDPAQLQRMAAAGSPPALMMAVCARFPAVHGDPDLDATIYQNLKKNAAQLPQTVTDQLDDLWASRMQTEDDPVKAAHLLELADTLALPANPRLLALDYYNGRLADLKSRETAQPSVQEQKQAIQTFLTQTALISHPRWPLTKADEQTLRRTSAALSLALNPPPPSRLSSEFQPATDGSGDYVYYPSFDSGHPMRFKKLRNKTTGNSFYICTTEATVGWFVGMFDDPHRQIVLRHLLDFTVPSKLCGPSTWRANLFRGIDINHDRSWLAFSNHNWDPDDSRYTPAGDGPTSLMPMQYVSPLASMYAAWLIGCRLPTPDEWQTAYESGQRDGDDNCSGQNWARIRASINGMTPPDISAPTCHRFRVELGIETDDAQPLLFGGSVRSDASDNLWFREVPTNSPTFHDMHGNVSEWVLSSAQDQQPPRFTSDKPITVGDETGDHSIANEDDAALATLYSHCLRVGLTSTSGKDDDPERAALPADSQANRHHQYFDVGFRLAMNDPATPTLPNFVALVQQLPPIAP